MTQERYMRGRSKKEKDGHVLYAGGKRMKNI